MKRASTLKPEYLILGLLNQHPAHGYQLHQAASQAGLWHLPQNQVYNLLKRLETQGDITLDQSDTSSKPERRIYRLTPRGLARFQEWYETPTPISARALRLAFLTRLSFALAEDRETARQILEAQKQAVREGVQRLQRRSENMKDTKSLPQLSLQLRIRQLETILTWMDDCRTVLGL